MPSGFRLSRRGCAASTCGTRAGIPQMRDYQLRPACLFHPRPSIYVGGKSAPARDLVTGQADILFNNG